MAKNPKRREPFFRFCAPDWRSDVPLRRCSYAARGLWIDMLSLMHEADPYGELRDAGQPLLAGDLVQLLGGTANEVKRLLAELESRQVFSRCDDGAIYSRRMRRDYLKAQANTDAGFSSGGNPEIIRGTIPKEDRVRPFKRSDAPAKTERIFQKKGGRCWWCDIPLQREYAGVDFFHVDHLTAVRDGGTNDEENLVPACAKCNHERARHQPNMANPTSTSDTNHQKTDLMSDPKAHVGAGAPGHFHNQKKDSDLRSADDAAEVNPKIALWRDGLSVFASLLGKPQSATRKLLGKLVDTFQGDHARLLALIRRAEIEQPDDPFAWLTSSAKPVNGTGNGLFADDPWGIGGWLAGERRVSEGAKDGQPVQAIGGYDARFVAEKVAEVAHLPASWRGSWRALADWLDEGIPSDAILSGVRQAVTWGGYKIPQTLSYFDKPVHEAAGRPAP